MNRRIGVIRTAVQEYDRDKILQRLTNKNAYVNQSLRDADLQPATEGEVRQAFAVERRAIIDAADAAYTRETSGRRRMICSRRAYIQESLREKGEPLARDDELLHIAHLDN